MQWQRHNITTVAVSYLDRCRTLCGSLPTRRVTVAGCKYHVISKIAMLQWTLRFSLWFVLFVNVRALLFFVWYYGVFHAFPAGLDIVGNGCCSSNSYLLSNNATRIKIRNVGAAQARFFANLNAKGLLTRSGTMQQKMDTEVGQSLAFLTRLHLVLPK
jgi:hypothetical protein